MDGPSGMRGVTLHLGVMLLVAGAFAMAFAASGLATLTTPAEELSADAGPDDAGDALERFRLRLDLNARLLGSGLALVAMGVLLALYERGAARRSGVSGVTLGIVAALVVAAARWQSVALDQFGAAWDHWLLVETLAWVAWALGVVLVVWPRLAGLRAPSAREAA